jgi:hypothetical protein
VEPLAFAHDLFREVLTAALPVAERARLHRTIATALDSGGGPASEIAAHWCARPKQATSTPSPMGRQRPRRAGRPPAGRRRRLRAPTGPARAPARSPPPPDLPRGPGPGWAAAQRRAGQGDQARANYRAAAATRGIRNGSPPRALGLHRLGAPRGRARRAGDAAVADCASLAASAPACVSGAGCPVGQEFHPGASRTCIARPSGRRSGRAGARLDDPAVLPRRVARPARAVAARLGPAGGDRRGDARPVAGGSAHRGHGASVAATARRAEIRAGAPSWLPTARCPPGSGTAATAGGDPARDGRADRR